MGKGIPYSIVRTNVPTQASAVVQVYPVRRRKCPFTPRPTVVRVGGLHRGDTVVSLQRARENSLANGKWPHNRDSTQERSRTLTQTGRDAVGLQRR
jgi:hypothetical protein